MYLHTTAIVLDLAAVLAGEMTPVFFGSAMNNFGVELFLQAFLEYVAKPDAHQSNGEEGAIQILYSLAESNGFRNFDNFQIRSMLSWHFSN